MPTADAIRAPFKSFVKRMLMMVRIGITMSKVRIFTFLNFSFILYYFSFRSTNISLLGAKKYYLADTLLSRAFPHLGEREGGHYIRK